MVPAGAVPAASLFSYVPVPRRIMPVTPVVWVPDNDPPTVNVMDLDGPMIALCPPRAPAPPAATWSGDTPVLPEPAPALDPVRLVRLPSGAIVFGGGLFLAACGDRFLADQFPPNAGRDHAAIDAIAPLDLPVIELSEEIVLVARFGLPAWSVWLCDLLPKIALTERAFPGRFSYALPPEVLGSGPGRSAWSPIAESLAVCGITPARIVPLTPDHAYRFAALHAVSPVRAGDLLHPEAAEAVRQCCADSVAGTARRLLIGPAAGFGAVIANANEITWLLEKRGFTHAPVATLPFAQQMAAMKGATTVFGSPGADLADLIFAPPGVRVIAAIPVPDGGMLHALVRERCGRLAELHGSAAEATRGGKPLLDPTVLGALLDALPDRD